MARGRTARNEVARIAALLLFTAVRPAGRTPALAPLRARARGIALNAAQSPALPPRAGRLALAWAVHLFTASGAVIAAVALFALMQTDFRTAGLLMLGALLVDSVDGALARRARVAELVPHIDGRRLDDVVDFLGYVIVPALFLLALGALPHWSLAALPILASAYGFSQHDAKTEDDFFLGWPSYWNVVALYVWLLEVGPVVTSLLVAALALAVFVPLKYVYPSKLRVLRGPTLVAAAAWGAAMTFGVLFPERGRASGVVQLSLLFPAWYMGLSAWLGRWGRRAR